MSKIQTLKTAKELLIGKRIKKVRLMSKKEAEETGLDGCPLVLVFEDGDEMFAPDANGLFLAHGDTGATLFPAQR